MTIACKGCGEQVVPAYSKCRRCLTCHKQFTKAWRLKNKDILKLKKLENHAKHPEKRRNRKYRKNYGITIEVYEAMFKAQAGVCKACQKPQMSKISALLCVDHDHKTGRVRGLLCSLCNTALGMLDDNPETLRRLVRYLK